MAQASFQHTAPHQRFSFLAWGNTSKGEKGDESPSRIQCSASLLALLKKGPITTDLAIKKVVENVSSIHVKAHQITLINV